MTQTDCETIDEYIAVSPEDVQEILEQVRETVRDAALDTEETISYQMPTFKLEEEILIHFGAYKHHIKFHLTPEGIEAFKEELTTYESAKGSVKYPLDESMPPGSPVKYPIIELRKSMMVSWELKGW